MNVIAIMNHMGVYFKEEPIRELHRALERLDFRIVYPNDREDLLKLIENNARLCGVIFDWDKYNLELCEDISKMNEYMPLYAFANTYSTLDVRSQRICGCRFASSNMRWAPRKILRTKSNRILTSISTPFCRR